MCQQGYLLLANLLIRRQSARVKNRWAFFQSRTQSPRAFWPAGERPERLWDNRLHFPRKRGFRSYDVWLSLNGSRKEKTVNSRNGGLKVFEKQEF